MTYATARVSTPISRRAQILNRAILGCFLSQPPMRAHKMLVALLSRLDNLPKLDGLHNLNSLPSLNDSNLASRPNPRSELTTQVGELQLPTPLMLAAGLVKGYGFDTEAEALQAVKDRKNIIPGWRSIPAIVGATEFGSFTLFPRWGNSGKVLWRDRNQKTLYNRIGLRNPGAKAAAEFLGERQELLPPAFGISIAGDPDNLSDLDGLAKAVRHFVSAGVKPSWVTLNLSCPNTSHNVAEMQQPEVAKKACEAVRQELPQDASSQDASSLDASSQDASSTDKLWRNSTPKKIPLWVKLGPELVETDYSELLESLAQAGVAAVIATNTLTTNLPATLSGAQAGAGGGVLHPQALRTVAGLAGAARDLPLEIIGCGGVMDGLSYLAMRNAGAVAVQYWSALVFRGPLAPRLILNEVA